MDWLSRCMGTAGKAVFEAVFAKLVGILLWESRERERRELAKREKAANLAAKKRGSKNGGGRGAEQGAIGSLHEGGDSSSAALAAPDHVEDPLSTFSARMKLLRKLLSDRALLKDLLKSASNVLFFGGGLFEELWPRDAVRREKPGKKEKKKLLDKIPKPIPEEDEFDLGDDAAAVAQKLAEREGALYTEGSVGLVCTRRFFSYQVLIRAAGVPSCCHDPTLSHTTVF